MSLTRRDAFAGLMAASAAALAPSRTCAADPRQPDAAPTEAAPTESADSIAAGRDRNDHLTPPVTLNGQGPFPFIVDTGASISCVSRTLAESLALPMGASRPVHTVVGVKSQRVALVEEMQVGVRRARGLTALALPLEQPSIQGVLAVDWLKGQRVTLNFAAGRLEFAASRHEDSRPGRVVVPARRRLGQLTIVDADLGERRISAMIDSGSEASLCNSALLKLLDRTQDRPARRQMIQMVTIIGEPFEGELVYLPFLRLGGLQMGNVGVVHSDSHVFDIWGLAGRPAVLLGMDLLRQFQAVSLDFGRSLVRFDLA